MWSASAAGEVVGVVRDEPHGRSFAGAMVALARSDQPDSTRWQDADHRMASGPGGVFRLEGVRPGRYRLIARAIGKTSINGESVEVVEAPSGAADTVRIQMRAGRIC